MKKFIVWVTIISLCLVFTACGGTGTNTQTQTQSQQAAAAETTAAAVAETTAETAKADETTKVAETTEAAEKTTAAAPADNAAKTESGGGDADAVIPLKYVIPGELSLDEDMVMDAVNESLASAGVPVKMERQAISWDIFSDRVNLMFTSGEEFDMLHIMQNWIPYNNYYSKGVLADITDLVDEYGPNLKEYIPEEMWIDSRIGGRNYIIPTYWAELAVDNYIFYRKDVFEKYNLKVPETPADILDCFRTVRADWNGTNLPILNYRYPSYDSAVLQLSPKLHRSYDTYPFIVKDAFFQVMQDGKINSWFESEEFKKDCAFMHEAYLENILQPDILSVNFDWADNYVMNGDGFLWTMPGYRECLINNPDLKTTDDGGFLLNPEKPAIRNWGIKNCNAVSITSKNPQGPIMFINWLLDNQDNYDLFIYGIEGEQWRRTANDPRGVDYINDPVTDEIKWDGVSWMIGNIKYIRYDTTGFMTYNSIIYNEDPNAINSIAGAFFFDATVFSTEYANVQAEATIVMTPIVMGVQSYDEYFPAAIDRLKAAGLDVLVAEYQKQLDEAIALR